MLRHADVQVLLCVSRYLGHDYLARLAEIADIDPHPEIRTPSHPFLRSVWVLGQPESEPKHPETKTVWAQPIKRLLAAGETVGDELLAAAEAQVTPADEAAMIYTSGSTAAPKAAVHTQGSVVGHAHNLWQFRDLDANDRLYTPMPLFWVGGLAFTLVAAIHAGATLVFEERFDPGETLALIERERVTIVAGWPHMSKMLTDHPDFTTRDLSSVRGGSLDALLPPEAQIGDPELRVNSLGMTETLGPHTLGMMSAGASGAA